MKGKGCFLFLVVVAAVIVVAAKIFLPPFVSAKQYAVCYAEASALLNDGKIVEGAGKLTEGLIAVGGYQALSSLDKVAVVSLVRENALKSPEQSVHLLEFLTANGIEVECDERGAIYKEFLKYGYRTYVKTGRSGSNGVQKVLFLAAAWSGSCVVDAENLKIYKQILDIYEKESGDSFMRSPWMDAAYAGKPVSLNGGAPVVNPVKSVLEAEKTDGAKEEVVTKAEETKTAPVEKPVDAQVNKQPETDTTKKDGKVPESKPAAKEKKDAQTSNPIMDKLKEMKQNEGGAYNSHDSKLKKAATDISSELVIKGVKNKDAYFSSSGKVFSISFQTASIGEKDTWNNTMLIFDTVHGTVKLDGGIPLERISVMISDLKGSIEGTVGVNYSDYLEYKNGKIDGNELAERMTLD